MSDRVMRKNKTAQDNLPADKRERVGNWNRVLSYSQQHKPKNSKDWLGLRKND